LTLAKCQAQMAVGKASKACGLKKQISILDDKVSSLTAKILHHEECNSFILGIIEFACEMLRCKFPFNLSFSFLLHCCFCDILCHNRHLFGFRCWRSSGYRAKCSSRKNVSRYWDFVVWSSTPECYCTALGPCPAYWQVSWWLPKGSHNYAFCYASSQSSACNFPAASWYF
jgi:hypothetical protein